MRNRGNSKSIELASSWVEPAPKHEITNLCPFEYQGVTEVLGRRAGLRFASLRFAPINKGCFHDIWVGCSLACPRY